MNKQAIKNKIVSNVIECGDQSFVNIEHIFEEHGFDYETGGKYIFNPDNDSIVFWHGWNDAAVEILQEIMAENKICLRTTHLITYVAEGKMVNLKIAKNPDHHYKYARWYPVLLVKG